MPYDLIPAAISAADGAALVIAAALIAYLLYALVRGEEL